MEKSDYARDAFFATALIVVAVCIFPVSEWSESVMVVKLLTVVNVYYPMDPYTIDIGTLFSRMLVEFVLNPNALLELTYNHDDYRLIHDLIRLVGPIFIFLGGAISLITMLE